MTSLSGNDTVEGIKTEELRQSEKDVKVLDKEIPNIVAIVEERFEQASTARQPFETRWLSSYRDYRGQWDPAKKLRDREKSRVFVKIPKTKTLAAQGQINEILFGANRFPLSIQATEKPEGVAEYAHFDPKAQQATEQSLPDFGFPGDGKRPNERSFLGGLQAKFAQGLQMFKPGPAETPDQVQVEPAKEAALQMEKTVKDQLTETYASRELRKGTLDMALYGTGVISGPFSYEDIIPAWEQTAEGRNYAPKKKLIPRIKHVSVWNFYPDPAATCIEDCEYAIERMKLNKSQLRKLRRMPFFLASNIDAVIMSGPNYVKQDFENSISETTDDFSQQSRWEVLVYWGIMDKEIVEEAGGDVSRLTNLDEIQVNIWVCNGTVLRVVANPFEPQNLPYHAVPYEKDPSEFWGVGVPENMADSTIIMNGHARMAIDNLALAGNLVFDVSEDSLVPGQPMDIYPGKIFRRQSGQSGQSIFGIKFPSTTQDNMSMFDRFRQFADEETGIPSYSHGQTGVNSTTRTASGMSMLMGAAALNAKSVVKNVDDYLLRPLGEAMYYWNMQFNDDVTIVGDLKVKAMGTDALMQKEIRSQRLLQFLQVTSNPMLAPWVKPGKIIKELVYAIDLDPDEIVNDLEQAKIYAAMIGQAGNMGGGPDMPSMNQGSTGTGGGNMTPANVAMPGEQQFSGNSMGGPNANTAETPS